jgi:Tol biopolymer transport system component/predicted Ser/Thr protein kinase
MIGTTLGHYRVDRELGSGGMGEVYAAEDLKLHRQVALKVLSAPLAGDAERRQRFEREAQAVAALNHPNIVTIHSVEQSGDVHFLTMELVAGKPLSELIPPRGLPLERVLKVAIPLADAVSAAHQRGITHRDLKPANIMIADDGRVKVLDFGLAKLKESPAANAATMLATQSLTGEGRILGTVAYMSPEQAEGRPVDHRSDIFSLGIVLYEMATGERPFKGDTSVSVLSSILKDTPRAITEVNHELPRDLGRIVRRCLMKDPEQRYQSAKDIRNDLEEVKQGLESGEIAAGAAAAPVHRRRPMLLAATVAAIAVAAVALWLWLRDRTPAGPIEATFTQLTGQKEIEQFPSLSPDGRWIVYAGNASGNFDIYLQSVSGQTPINLTKDTNGDDDLQPAFSPDGETIAFRSDRDGGGIFVMGRTGESLRRITDAGYNPAWSPNGREIVYASESMIDSPGARGPRSDLWVLDVASGERRKIATDDALQPYWSPHGFRIAYWSAVGRQRQRDIFTISADGRDPVRVTDDAAIDWNPVWSPDGRHLYFSSERGGSMNLWRVPIDERSGRVLGALQPVTAPARFAGQLTISADGRRIAYSSIEFAANVQRLAFDPDKERIIGEPHWVTSGSKLWMYVDVSPDGERVVLTSGRPQEDVFIARADGTGLRQLTNDVALDRDPQWSPDGRRISFYSNRGGSWDAWRINPDGSGLTALTKKSGAHYPTWSPDGSKMAFSEIVDVVRVSVFDPRAPWESQTPERLPNPPSGRWRASSWSFDGRSLAGCDGSASLGAGVLVYTFESRSFTKLTDRGCSPVWLADNRRLLFTHARNTVAVVDRDSGAARDILSRPNELIELQSVSRDGRQLFLLVHSKEADIWMATLK